jgi:glycosyltransferase involved in cell wall biosynthesis
MPTKLKILVSAYACCPNKGSEPGMGWNFVYGLSKFHEVHIITEEKKWKNSIETELELNPELRKNLKFYFIEKKRKRILRKIWPPSYYLFYRKWQKNAFQLAKELNAKENFDIVHQLNMVGYREPGYLWKIDKPFVWGPIGGMNITPWKMLPVMGIYGGLFYVGRNLINLFQMHFQARPRFAAQRNNSILISATNETRDRIKMLWNKDSHIITEVGLLDVNNAVVRKDSSSLKVCWSGLHIPRKALNILIEALSKTNNLDRIELHVLGDGPVNKPWRRLANKFGVDNRIIWHGWLDKDKAVKIMQQSDLFCITSLSDLTSTVTLEALSLGLPIIALNHCGFSNVINETCGFKIDIKNISQVSNDIALRLDELCENRNKLKTLQNGAVLRAKDFSWDKKISQLNDIYQTLLKENEKN